MSIEDNLRLGAYTRARNNLDADLERMYELFPILKEKRALPAGTLSGGQQQMLAMARALMDSQDCCCWTSRRWDLHRCWSRRPSVWSST